MTNGASVRVPGFVPSTNGLHFDNSFPDEPAVIIDVGVAKLPIGNAANGLCGGMVFAALDYWKQGSPAPSETTPPPAGTPLFNYLVRRLIDSWDIPGGPLTYLKLMNPLLPDGDDHVGPFSVHGRGWRMAVREWPAIKSSIDAGNPCPLGLVKLKSANPLALGHNHQVLAYGYDQTGTAITLWLYDPNQSNTDDVALRFDIARPSAPIPVTMGPTPPTRPMSSASSGWVTGRRPRRPQVRLRRSLRHQEPSAGPLAGAGRGSPSGAGRRRAPRAGGRLFWRRCVRVGAGQVFRFRGGCGPWSRCATAE